MGSKYTGTGDRKLHGLALNCKNSKPMQMNRQCHIPHVKF